MKITDAFLGEHGVFYTQFDYLEEALGVPVELERVRDLASMLESALETHAKMEDELLFDPLGDDDGLLRVMKEEHEKIGDTLRTVGRVTQADTAARLLREVVWMARDHFRKEEEAAFPAAVARLGAAELERLGRVWAQRRAVQLA